MKKDSFPQMAQVVLGADPEKILESTNGRPFHFYYICILIVWVSFPVLLWFEVRHMFGDWQKSLGTFIIEYMSYNPDDTIRYAVAIAFLPAILLIIILRPLLYPTGKDGHARWRWDNQV